MLQLFRPVNLVVLCFASTLAIAQIDLQGEAVGGDVIVHGRNKGSEAGELLVQAVWRGVPSLSPSFDLQPMSSSAQDHPLQLDHLLESGITAYLDAKIHFSKQGVKADLAADRMQQEMEAMVHAAIGSIAPKIQFEGFSVSTEEQLSRLAAIDWSQAKNAVNGGTDEDKYLAIYFYVRSQREEFQRAMRRDMIVLRGIDIHGPGDVARAAKVSIASTCGTVFDDEEYLCALDLRLADTGKGGLDVALPDHLAAYIASTTALQGTSVPKRDRWLKEELDRINARIDNIDQRQEILELRDRIDDLTDRITGLELEMREGLDRPGITGTLRDRGTADAITIRFARGSTEIGNEYHELLEHVRERAASSEESILIIGFTDRAGDPEVNLKLSEARAKAVRHYLLESGIAPERLLLNFHGDSQSSENDPSERRVVIEWLDR